MPLLAGLFGSIFSGLLAYFVQYFTKKIALYLASVSALALLTASLLLIFKAAFASIHYALPVAAGTLTAFLPSNLSVCLSAYGACALAKWVYDWNTTIILKMAS